MTQPTTFKPGPILTDLIQNNRVLNLSPLHLMRVIMLSVFVFPIVYYYAFKPLVEVIGRYQLSFP